MPRPDNIFTMTLKDALAVVDHWNSHYGVGTPVNFFIADSRQVLSTFTITPAYLMRGEKGNATLIQVNGFQGAVALHRVVPQDSVQELSRPRLPPDQLTFEEINRLILGAHKQAHRFVVKVSSNGQYTIDVFRDSPNNRWLATTSGRTFNEAFDLLMERLNGAKKEGFATENDLLAWYVETEK